MRCRLGTALFLPLSSGQSQSQVPDSGDGGAAKLDCKSQDKYAGGWGVCSLQEQLWESGVFENGILQLMTY